MGFSARATPKGAARTRRRRPCTPPRSSSTLPARLKISADRFCARVLEFFSVTVFGATVFVLFETRLVHLLTDATKLFDRLNSSRQIVVSSSPVHRRREASNLVGRSIKRHCPTFRNQ